MFGKATATEQVMNENNAVDTTFSFWLKSVSLFRMIVKMELLKG